MSQENFDPYDFSQKDIRGVPVYYKHLPWAPCIHIYIVFNTGAFHDPVGKEGLSHFLEHMIFDGSPTLPNKKVIDEWGKLYALNTWNAWTSHYNTAYHLECLPEHYDTALSGMKDMIFSPFLRLEDVEHERSVITQEAWGRYQNEKYLKYIKEIIDILYHGHEHARVSSALGWPETVKEMSGEDINLWHKKHYGIGNFSIIIAGKIEESHIEKLGAFLENIPHTDTSHIDHTEISKPKTLRFIKIADEIGEIKEQVEISFMRVRDRLDRNISQTVSAFRRLSYDILYEKLRTERSLCYGVRVNTYLEKDYSQFFVNLQTDEKNIEIVETTFWKTIEEIKSGQYKDRFEIIKKLGIDQVRSEELLSEDIIGRSVGDVSKYSEKPKTQSQKLKEMSEVTHEDIVTFTKETFDPEYTLTEIILPTRK